MRAGNKHCVLNNSHAFGHFFLCKKILPHHKTENFHHQLSSTSLRSQMTERYSWKLEMFRKLIRIYRAEEKKTFHCACQKQSGTLLWHTAI